MENYELQEIIHVDDRVTVFKEALIKKDLKKAKQLLELSLKEGDKPLLANALTFQPDDKSALMYVCEQGMQELAELLIRYQADVNAESQGQTALSYALKSSLPESEREALINLLLSQGALPRPSEIEQSPQIQNFVDYKEGIYRAIIAEGVDDIGTRLFEINRDLEAYSLFFDDGPFRYGTKESGVGLFARHPDEFQSKDPRQIVDNIWPFFAKLISLKNSLDVANLTQHIRELFEASDWQEFQIVSSALSMKMADDVIVRAQFHPSRETSTITIHSDLTYQIDARLEFQFQNVNTDALMTFSIPFTHGGKITPSGEIVKTAGNWNEMFSSLQKKIAEAYKGANKDDRSFLGKIKKMSNTMHKQFIKTTNEQLPKESLFTRITKFLKGLFGIGSTTAKVAKQVSQGVQSESDLKKPTSVNRTKVTTKSQLESNLKRSAGINTTKVMTKLKSSKEKLSELESAVNNVCRHAFDTIDAISEIDLTEKQDPRTLEELMLKVIVETSALSAMKDKAEGHPALVDKLNSMMVAANNILLKLDRLTKTEEQKEGLETQIQISSLDPGVIRTDKEYHVVKHDTQKRLARLDASPEGIALKGIVLKGMSESDIDQLAYLVARKTIMNYRDLVTLAIESIKPSDEWRDFSKRIAEFVVRIEPNKVIVLDGQTFDPDKTTLSDQSYQEAKDAYASKQLDFKKSRITASRDLTLLQKRLEKDNKHLAQLKSAAQTDIKRIQALESRIADNLMRVMNLEKELGLQQEEIPVKKLVAEGGALVTSISSLDPGRVSETKNLYLKDVEGNPLLCRFEVSPQSVSCESDSLSQFSKEEKDLICYKLAELTLVNYKGQSVISLDSADMQPAKQEISQRVAGFISQLAEDKVILVDGKTFQPENNPVTEIDYEVAQKLSERFKMVEGDNTYLETLKSQLK